MFKINYIWVLYFTAPPFNLHSHNNTYNNKMRKKSFINKILQNTRKPEGFFGRMILRGMNIGHSKLSLWGMSQLNWQVNWNVLDIGCGGGANLEKMLEYCPKGKVYGLDISPESVLFAQQNNKIFLGPRCFVHIGSVNKLPYENEMFNVVTAFETIYFWDDLNLSFTEIARVLKKNNYFLICCEMSDPNNETWTSRIDGMIVHPAHQLESILQKCGFTNIIIHHRKKENLCIIAQKA